MLHELSNISEGVVIKRPSQHIKSPYVADGKCSFVRDDLPIHW